MTRTIIRFILIFWILAGTVRAAENYTLYNILTSNTARLIDLDGNLVKTWTCARTPCASTPWLILPDSIVLRAQNMINPPMSGNGGNIQLLSWNNTVLWDYYYAATNYQQHHDVRPMPNGHVLLIAWERKTNAEAVAMGRVGLTGEMWPDKIVEVNPQNSSVVWEWKAWDHLIQDVDPGKPNYGVISEHPELLDINFGPVQNGDWMHVNTVDYNEELDQITFSSHTLSEIYIIDHSTTTAEAAGHTGGNSGMGGDFLYRWGNPQGYDRGDSTDQHLFIVHGVNWIDPGYPGAGNLLMFNNGDRPGSANDYSSVEEIVAPRTGYTYYIHPDSAFGPPGPVWSYSNPGGFYSYHLSGAFRLTSGNTFVCEGVPGHLFEVNTAGSVIWNFQCGNQVQNCRRYDFNPSGADEGRLTDAWGSFAVYPNPFKVKCNITIGQGHRADEVTIKIFDVSGRMVRDLSAPGSGTALSWDRFDGRGKKVPAGVYLIRLTVKGAEGAREGTIKLVVMD